MKRLRFSLLTVVIALLASTLACDGSSTPYIPPTEPPPQPTDEPPPPQPSGLADLRFLILGLEYSTQPGFQFDMVSTIANGGPVDADGFDAGCTYSCPGGPISGGGLDIVINGYVAANSSFEFRHPVQIACQPIPAVLFFTCTINEDGSVPESNMSNNTMNYRADFP